MLDKQCLYFIIVIELSGASPSGKAPGFGPGIPEVRILPPQPIKESVRALFFVIKYLYENVRKRKMPKRSFV